MPQQGTKDPLQPLQKALHPPHLPHLPRLPHTAQVRAPIFSKEQRLPTPLGSFLYTNPFFTNLPIADRLTALVSEGCEGLSSVSVPW